jgi:hypothetical protein
MIRAEVVAKKAGIDASKGCFSADALIVPQGTDIRIVAATMFLRAD